jgi:hypothetical protein
VDWVPAQGRDDGSAICERPAANRGAASQVRHIIPLPGRPHLAPVPNIAVAMALNKPFRGVAVVRAMAFAGYLLPPIVIALSFRWMGLAQNGVINTSS